MTAKISLVIPAYNYFEGVQKILNALKKVDDNIEIIISDDSSDDHVMNVALDYSRRFKTKIKYIRNKPPLGAVSNWNYLIKESSGSYIMLLHHDEYPLTDNFIPKILKLFEDKPNVDVFVLDCILMSDEGIWMRPHLPKLIRNFLIKNTQAYVLKRNFIGPASCLIVKKDFYPLFDSKLKWLVDVDLYYRLFKKRKNIYVCNSIKIGSVVGRKESITAQIKSKLSYLKVIESEYICGKYPELKMWPMNNKKNILSLAEDVLWIIMRVSTLFFSTIIHSLNKKQSRNYDHL